MGYVFSDIVNDEFPISVDGGRFLVFSAPVQANDEDAPTWGDFVYRPNVKFQRAIHGSGVAGMSYANLELVPEGDTRIENASPINQGDRVKVAFATGNNLRWLFAGYQTSGQIQIAKTESLGYRAMGPEWFWGMGGNKGASSLVYGQWRRLAHADDDALASGLQTNTPYDEMMLVRALPTIFNPKGRRNMSVADVRLSPAGDAARCWEDPDRSVSGVLVSKFWTLRQAVRTLVAGFDLPTSGITVANLNLLPDDKPIPEVDVDGLGLWAALLKVLAPDYSVSVDPRPTVEGWGGFRLYFHKLGQDVEETEANLHLNPLDTSILEAKPSITRLEAVKDISGTMNDVTVLGKQLRHVRLVYWGRQTPELTDEQKKTALQSGWTRNDLDLVDLVGVNTETNELTDTIDRASIDALPQEVQIGPPPVGLTTQAYRRKYRTDGSEFSLHSHAARLFVWNEGGEFISTGEQLTHPVYGGVTALPYFQPEISEIAATGPYATTGGYVRRGRPLKDTPYLEPSYGEWKRVRATLFIAAVDEMNANAPLVWHAVPRGHYRIDDERAGVWITVQDLAEWYPLRNQQHNGDPMMADSRTFLTLLYTGKLRLMLEGTIEMDDPLMGKAPRRSVSGSPLVRKSIIRAEREWMATSTYEVGLPSPTGMVAKHPNDLATATAYAEQARANGERQATHASLMTAADWPLQRIGKLIQKTTGREINLRAGGTDAGAQIVARVLNADTYSIEYLTESVALKLRRKDRQRVRPGSQARAGRKITGEEAA